MKSITPRAIFLLVLATLLLPSGLRVAAQANPVKVSGRVTDSRGAPLPGVSVAVGGTSKGVTTDAQGRYTLAGVPASATLVFSFVGMKRQEVPLGGRTTLNVTLEPADEQLDELVVVGYGVQKRVNLTGAVSLLSAKELTDRPVKNAVDLLQGLSPGLNITQSSGNIGETASINIRGVTTLGDGSNGSPLVLIDGMEGDLSLVNPQDIANISVLKDAASSSIYGTRAPFGVILVTTKSGESGRVSLSYSAGMRSGGPNMWPRVSDSETFAYVVNDNSMNDGSSPFFSREWLDRIIRYKNGERVPMLSDSQGRWINGYNGGHANADWMREVFSSRAPAQEHNLSMSGGGSRMRYYLSGGFMNQTGLIRVNPDNLKRYNVTARVSVTPVKGLEVELINRFVRKSYERPTFLNDKIWENILRQGWPVLPIYDDNGYLFDNGASPVLKLRDGGRNSEVKDVGSYQLNATLTPLKGWRIVGSASYESSNIFRQGYQVPFFNHDVNRKPYPASNGTESEVSEYAFKSDYLNLNLYTDYERTIGRHSAKVMAGSQVERFFQRDLSASNTGLISPLIRSLNASTGVDSRGSIIPPSINGTYNDWAVAGFFGRANYSYDSRYLLELNLRYDGSSRFRRENRWMLLPSLSLGWSIANERFWKVKAVNLLKVRYSYGSLGNQNTKVWYPTYQTQPFGIQDGAWLVNGNRPNTAKAPDLISRSLTWERVVSHNYGVDWGLFGSKLTGSFDYFIRNTLNMVGPAPELPNTLGTAVPKQNNTDLQTYGFDLSITWRHQVPIAGDQLSYSVALVLSDAQTRITRYPNKAKSLTTYREGQLMGEIWGYETIGIAKTKQEMEAHLATLPNGGQLGYTNLSAGDIMYRDLNGDGRISSGASTLDDPGDRRIIGNDTPRFRLGTTISAAYGGFDFKAFFQGVLKRDYITESQLFFPGGGIWSTIILDDQLDYYRPDKNHPLGQNLNPYFGRPISDGRNRYPQSRFLLDASYVRLKNLTLGYSLPERLLRPIGLKQLRLYLSGENLLTFTRLSRVFDPELIRTDSKNTYPIFRTYAMGLNITL